MGDTEQSQFGRKKRLKFHQGYAAILRERRFNAVIGFRVTGGGRLQACHMKCKIKNMFRMKE